MTRAGLLTAGVLLIVSCGGSPQLEPSLPDTAADPLPYTPAPTGSAVADGAVGVSIAGGRDAGRAMAIQFITAVRDGDIPGLSELLAERLSRVVPRPTQRAIDRQRALGILIANSARLSISDLPVELIVDMDQIATMPLSEAMGQLPIPDGLLPTDIVVRLPLTPRGAGARLAQGWGSEGAILVRGSGPGAIIGF